MDTSDGWARGRRSRGPPRDRQLVTRVLGQAGQRGGKKTGKGRATLYKYLPDFEAILLAWHERQITAHLAHFAEARGRSPGERLPAVLRPTPRSLINGRTRT